jgi:hypothetical protein
MNEMINRIIEGLRATQWSKVIKNGILATIVMELFYRITDLIFHHEIDVSYGIGTIFSSTSTFVIYLSGYLIYLFGGVAFSFLYERFVRTKNTFTGIIYAVLFVWLLVDGFLFEPMGPDGILMFGAGFKAVLVNMLAHVVYGSVIGFLFSEVRHKIRSL